MSEPGTAVDVGHYVHLLYHDHDTQQKSKLLIDDTPMESTIQGVQHVDDILEIADVSLLGVFTLEFLIKVIANGFSGKPLAYLYSSMNQ